MNPNNDVPNHAQHRRLEPLEPARARSLYLKSRRDELAKRSLELHTKHVGSFVEWCDETVITNMNDVTARTIHEYQLSIRDGFAQSTLSIYLTNVRQFVKFCEGIDAVASGVAERIVLPDRDRNSRSEMLESEDANEILAYLRRYHFASRTHALMTVLWHTGIRTGTIYALDLSDFEREHNRLRIRHRPETGSPLKNGQSAERYIAVSPDVGDVVAEYIETARHDVTDEYDREPLFTTKNGRPAKNSIRRNIYAATRPCATGFIKRNSGSCSRSRRNDNKTT